ncbi:MAG: hypothetical protein WCY75_02340 [Sulfurimonadaceae bacterium]
MNIELRFLQKAIENKNFICFTYENKRYNNIGVLKLDENNQLISHKGIFKFEKISQLVVLKEKISNLDMAYLKSVEDIKKGDIKIQSAKEHIEELKKEEFL